MIQVLCDCMSHARCLSAEVNQQHQQHQHQQQTASPPTNHSVAHTQALGREEGRSAGSRRFPTSHSAGPITLIDRRVGPGGTPLLPLHNTLTHTPPHSSREGGRDRCCVAADDTQKKVCGRMRKFRARIDGYTPTVLALLSAAETAAHAGISIYQFL